VRDIVLYPDPRLRRPTNRVEVFDEEFAEFVAELTETVEAAEGLGLSANQVGDDRSVLVLVPTEDEEAPRVYVNPDVVREEAMGIVQESCLSIPGIAGNVMRATQVTVRAQDVEGEPFEVSLSGMDAVCLLHEVDHLAGVLFIDRLNAVRRLLLRLQGKTTKYA
jgi:peptide deformylase